MENKDECVLIGSFHSMDLCIWELFYEKQSISDGVYQPKAELVDISLMLYAK